MQIDETLTGNTEVFEPRILGDHLLVAQLGYDALGTVYRALDSADERRFVRLRILQSGEISPEAVLAAVQRNSKPGAALFHEAIVRRALFGMVDGVPFMAWHETAGWTLDTVLARARALKLEISTEHALLIAERVATALEHAHLTVLEGKRAHHGLLWPGFVSVSNDADVRVGGFGLAEAVLPSLHKPRLANEIAPYIAPEVRDGEEVGGSSDVYSLGSLLLELLTRRRPSLAAPLPNLRAGDPFSDEIGGFLRLCLGPPAERFRSAVEMRRALRELMAASPHSLSNAGLALFLYRLLNPESRIVPASSDGESTVPVVVEPVPAGVPPFESPLSASPPPTHDIARLPAPEDARPRARRSGAALLLFLAIASGTFLLTRAWFEAGPADAAPRGVSEPQTIRPSKASAPAAKPLPARKRRAVNRETSAAVPAASPREGLASAMASARSSRFQAGVARVEAEWLDAPVLAAVLFGEGQDREKEGDRLLRALDYDAARLAFLQAREHFQRAEDISREERARRLDLASLR